MKKDTLRWILFIPIAALCAKCYTYVVRLVTYVIIRFFLGEDLASLTPPLTILLEPIMTGIGFGLVLFYTGINIAPSKTNTASAILITLLWCVSAFYTFMNVSLIMEFGFMAEFKKSIVVCFGLILSAIWCTYTAFKRRKWEVSSTLP